MSRLTRLFDIVSMLRAAPGALTASRIAAELGVTVRTIYRDADELRAMGLPLEGGRGVGYMLRPGAHLPPLNFTVDEIEAVVMGLALLERTGDPGFAEAAGRVERKVAASVPAPLRRAFETQALHAWGASPRTSPALDLAQVRRAIREERKIALHYADGAGRRTRRVVRPIALIYYAEAINIVAWCELREAIRNFRAERVVDGDVLEDRFAGEGDALRRLWVEGWHASASAREHTA
ncbi:MAG: helix-turn-helix transcriptional regulator [Flavobacteriaceae bacterium]